MESADLRGLTRLKRGCPEDHVVTLKQQGLLAEDLLVAGLILPVIFGGELAAPGFHDFGYGIEHPVGYGRGISLSALPDPAPRCDRNLP